MKNMLNISVYLTVEFLRGSELAEGRESVQNYCPVLFMITVGQGQGNNFLCLRDPVVAELKTSYNFIGHRLALLHNKTFAHGSWVCEQNQRT
jgi:hypothetical protein